MTRTRTIASTSALAAAIGLAGCRQGAGTGAPWLTMPSPEEHAARFFPANAGTPHEAASCGDCHAATSETFREFDCYGCHIGGHANPSTVASWHAAAPGFASTSAACKACHPDGRGIASSVDHARFFPIAAGTRHAAIACASCHNDRANRLDLACAGCHPHDPATAAAQHAAVSGYAFASSLCVRCHADGQVDRVAAHAALLPEPFLIADVPGNSHVGNPGGECLRCHVHERCTVPGTAPPCPPGTVEFLPAMRTDKPWAADFTPSTCVDCHVQADVDDKHFDPLTGLLDPPDYEFTTAACRRCHPGGS
jgi:hypothetical protein